MNINCVICDSLCYAKENQYSIVSECQHDNHLIFHRFFSDTKTHVYETIPPTYKDLTNLVFYHFLYKDIIRMNFDFLISSIIININDGTQYELPFFEPKDLFYNINKIRLYNIFS